MMLGRVNPVEIQSVRDLRETQNSYMFLRGHVGKFREVMAHSKVEHYELTLQAFSRADRPTEFRRELFWNFAKRRCAKFNSLRGDVFLSRQNRV
jgi:hypothetical protein